MLARLLLTALAAMPAAAATCESLSTLKLKDTVLKAARVERWDTELSAGGPTTPFCRVTGTLAPTSDSDIQIEVRLPDPADWNGKYQAVGNGGWSGSINANAMREALRRGYATSSTDTGHSGGSAKFALGHPEKLIDYAYRSEHLMVVAAKAIIAAYYETPLRHAYWNGCSAGGKQALKEAQRYPDDFDGIIAGAPAANWTGRAGQSVWVAQAVHNDPASYIPPALYPVIHRAVLAACDKLDGVGDGILEDPTRCTFDPKVLLCEEGHDQECLTAPQVEAARKIYSASINPRTKKPVYTGLYRGSELGWNTWGGPNPLAIGLDYFRYVVFEKPDWDFRTLDFDKDIARAEQLDHDRIDALDPNLGPYLAHGKLIQYHGWNDPQISPGNSVEYYQSVVERMGAAKIKDSYRLFMVPGMAHCGGGEGPNSFDMVSALENWVEKKQAPESIVAARLSEGKPVRTRPLCQYPQVAIYKGSGSTDDAANFECRLPKK